MYICSKGFNKYTFYFLLFYIRYIQISLFDIKNNSFMLY